MICSCRSLVCKHGCVPCSPSFCKLCCLTSTCHCVTDQAESKGNDARPKRLPCPGSWRQPLQRSEQSDPRQRLQLWQHGSRLRPKQWRYGTGKPWTRLRYHWGRLWHRYAAHPRVLAFYEGTRFAMVLHRCNASTTACRVTDLLLDLISKNSIQHTINDRRLAISTSPISCIITVLTAVCRFGCMHRLDCLLQSTPSLVDIQHFTWLDQSFLCNSTLYLHARLSCRNGTHWAWLIHGLKRQCHWSQQHAHWLD